VLLDFVSSLIGPAFFKRTAVGTATCETKSLFTARDFEKRPLDDRNRISGAIVKHRRQDAALAHAVNGAEKKQTALVGNRPGERVHSRLPVGHDENRRKREAVESPLIRGDLGPDKKRIPSTPRSSSTAKVLSPAEKIASGMMACGQSNRGISQQAKKYESLPLSSAARRRSLTAQKCSHCFGGVRSKVISSAPCFSSTRFAPRPRVKRASAIRCSRYIRRY